MNVTQILQTIRGRRFTYEETHELMLALWPALDSVWRDELIIRLGYAN